VTATVIEVRDLEFGWSTRQPLLRIEYLAITATERVFVHGPSGSGKSSLLSVLAGLVLPQQGSLRVLGTEVPQLAAAARDAFRADHFGIIFQMFNLVPYLSIVENVTLPCRFSVRRRRQVEALGGPTREAQRQQQRVAAARALIGRPEIVLADEPTSALDADRREAFLRLLFRECEAEGATLLFVSHDRSLERLFDRSLALNDVTWQPAGVET
jgi:putative ABC transport system ATP-binding protein